MAVNPEAKSNINPITLVAGEDETEFMVSVTNSGTNGVFEPLTDLEIEPGQTLAVLVQGQQFNECVVANFDQLKALYGEDELEVISGVVGGEEWPVVVAGQGCTMTETGVDGYRRVEWDGVYQNFSPLSPALAKPGLYVFNEPMIYDDIDFVITVKRPDVSSDDVIMIGISDYPVGNFDNEALVAFAVLPGGECVLMSNAPMASDIQLGVIPLGEEIQLRCTGGQLTATSTTIGNDVEAPPSSIVNNGSGKTIFLMSFSETTPNPVEFKISEPEEPEE